MSFVLGVGEKRVVNGGGICQILYLAGWTSEVDHDLDIKIHLVGRGLGNLGLYW
jgi:hypothetical protein